MTAKTVCADCRFAEWVSNVAGRPLRGTERAKAGICTWEEHEDLPPIPAAWVIHFSETIYSVGGHKSCPVYERKSDD
jgi:hypothetical protein